MASMSALVGQPDPDRGMRRCARAPGITIAADRMTRYPRTLDNVVGVNVTCTNMGRPSPDKTRSAGSRSTRNPLPISCSTSHAISTGAMEEERVFPPSPTPPATGRHTGTLRVYDCPNAHGPNVTRWGGLPAPEPSGRGKWVATKEVEEEERWFVLL